MVSAPPEQASALVGADADVSQLVRAVLGYPGPVATGAVNAASATWTVAIWRH